MTDFTTRPEISGTFGMATSTHWLASATGPVAGGETTTSGCPVHQPRG